MRRKKKGAGCADGSARKREAENYTEKGEKKESDMKEKSRERREEAIKNGEESRTAFNEESGRKEKGGFETINRKIEYWKSKHQDSANPIWKLFFKLWDIFMNREMITYLISGVLTTAVNWILYYLIVKKLGMEELSGNALDWILTVAFAYAVNAFWVFQSKFSGWKEEWAKILKFYSARFLTFLVEEGGLLLFVKGLGWNDLVLKAVLAVAVIILNYIFSKVFVFLK